MNDEIKEILENVKKCCDITIEQNFTVYQRQDILKLLDYITNLQEENQRLKELCDKYEEEHNNEFKIWKDERHQLLDYKSRCEKANEYIKKNTHEYKMFNEELGHFSNLTNISIDKNNKVFINDLLKILGGDKE